MIDGRGSGQNSRRRHKDTPRAWWRASWKMCGRRRKDNKILLAGIKGRKGEGGRLGHHLNLCSWPLIHVWSPSFDCPGALDYALRRWHLQASWCLSPGAKCTAILSHLPSLPVMATGPALAASPQALAPSPPLTCKPLAFLRFLSGSNNKSTPLAL